jgi:hypothetical protein
MTVAPAIPAVRRRHSKEVNTVTRRYVSGLDLYDSLETNSIEAQVNSSG